MVRHVLPGDWRPERSPLEGLSGKKRAARLDAIRGACQEYIHGPLREQMETLLRRALEAARLPADRGRVELDADDPGGQSLLLWYPTVTAAGNDYIRRAIKIESGAKSVLDLHAPVTVRPFVADDLAGARMVANLGRPAPVVQVYRDICEPKGRVLPLGDSAWHGLVPTFLGSVR